MSSKLYLIILCAVLLCLVSCVSQEALNPSQLESEISKSASESTSRSLALEDNIEELYTSEEYSALRQTIPYIERDLYSSYLIDYPIVKDDTGKKLAHFIQTAICQAFPDQSFTSVHDSAAQIFIRNSSVFATNPCTWAPDYAFEEIPQLIAFAPLAEEHSVIYMQEHVANTAKKLFGSSVELEHKEIPHQLAGYNELGGIYYPAPFGFEAGPHTIILSYEEYEDRFEVQAIFTYYTGESFMFYDTDNQLTENDFIEYCKAEPVHTITLKKVEDGTLVYYAHILPEDQ